MTRNIYPDMSTNWNQLVCTDWQSHSYMLLAQHNPTPTSQLPLDVQQLLLIPVLEDHALQHRQDLEPGRLENGLT